MPRIKNKLFQPVLVMLNGGKSLYLQSREETDIGKNDLDAPHLKGMMEKNHIVLVEEDGASDTSSTEDKQKLLPSPKGRGK
jgi:hypothetical protein